MPVASSEDQVLISRASVEAILCSLAAASSLLAEGVAFVPQYRPREPADETVVAEDLDGQEEAEEEEPRKGKHVGKDTRKGRSKGKPRDASRSRSGDRRGQSQGGTCGSSLCLPRKGNNKGRSKDKDAPLSKTPCFYKSRYEDEGCECWASFRVWMRGRASSPKERAVCATCGDWLFEPKDGADPLADNYGTV